MIQFHYATMEDKPALTSCFKTAGAGLRIHLYQSVCLE